MCPCCYVDMTAAAELPASWEKSLNMEKGQKGYSEGAMEGLGKLPWTRSVNSFLHPGLEPDISRCYGREMVVAD